MFCNSKTISKLFTDECWKLVLAESAHEIAMEKAVEDVCVLIKDTWTYMDRYGEAQLEVYLACQYYLTG